jgi:hypothetical protein
MITRKADKKATPTEILKAMGAEKIATPMKIGKHHLICGREFANDTQRALVAVLIAGNGVEHLKQINSNHDLRCATDPLVGRNGSYYELNAAQADALNAALYGEVKPDQS